MCFTHMSLSDVSTGEFIDTWPLSHSRLAGGTVNCCQHIEDLKAIGNSRYHNNFLTHGWVYSLVDGWGHVKSLKM